MSSKNKNNTNSNRNHLIIFLSILVLICVFLSPTPDGLTVEGKNTIGIFITAIILWTTNALPLAVTGLYVIISLSLFEVMSSEEAFSLFGNKAVFFILGAFILATAIMKTQLSERIALKLIKKFGNTPSQLIVSILLSSAFLSFIMPEHAVAAIMFPVISTIANNLNLDPLDSEYGASLFLSLAWGSIIGGVGTLLGGARNPLAIGLLEKFTDTTITFTDWCIAVIPIVFIMLIIGYLVLKISFKTEIDDIKPAKNALYNRLNEIGHMKNSEKKAGIILILTITLWICAGHILGLAIISIISVIMLFIFNVIEWQDVETNVNWGIILMYGGAIAMGSALTSSGATEWMINLVLNNIQLTPLIVVLAISFISIFLTECISNSATVAILIPIGFSIANTVGISPVLIVFLVAVPSGLAFIFPMGTPPNAIAYSSGYYEIKDVLVPGLVLNISAWICFLLMVKFYWPLIGLQII